MDGEGKRTARFSEVVQACGKPEAVTLWTKPQENKSFMGAVKQDRVMTVKQEAVGTKKDSGAIGFRAEKGVTYFVFPKPLTAFKDRRIVGIRYDLVKT